MAKMIDGAKLVEKLRLIAKCWSVSPSVSKEKHNGAVDMLREVEREVKEAPTLTPPNEPEYREYTCPNCHHTWLEDRDATDYPGYCPGCGEPLHKEENDPLTLEKLREMNETPIYVVTEAYGSGWCIVNWHGVNKSYTYFSRTGTSEGMTATPLSVKTYGDLWTAYRRPPGGEANG